MGIFEFLMLVCFGISWPFSIAKSIKSRSTQGKSIVFLCFVEIGYVFGIVHKIINNFNWVTYVYMVLFCVVGIDILLYLRNRRLDAKGAK
ncbi:MAG: hypothetical protein II909_04420 [Kiritimatiellae bacterium]|nr:hypothetical protein [Kiritimatiellia bacterium]